VKQSDKNIQEFLTFLKFERRFSQKTIEAYGKDIEDFFSFVQKKGKKFSQVNKDLIFEYHQDIELQISPRTFSRKLSSLRTFFRFLNHEGIINDSVMYEVKSYPSPKFKKHIPSYISKKQFSQLIEDIKDDSSLADFERFRNLSILSLFFSSGLRLEELTSIKRSDIDFHSNTIKVLGKGNKERIINFDSLTNDFLEKFIQIFDRIDLNKIKVSDNLFCKKLKNEFCKLSRFNIQYIVMNSLKKLNINSVGPHTLRHSFATHLLNSGVELNAIKELMGHESISSTQVYTHVNIAKLTEELENAHPRGKK
jgi:site-specific recombinase XerD